MPTFGYTQDIPDAPNNPSNDQGPMKVNTNSIFDLIKVDHYGFNDSLGGLHKQVQMPVLGAIPAGLIGSEGTLYTKSSTGSQLFYTPDTSGNEYQITRTASADFATFGANPNGWTFLPGGTLGGLLLQYGTVALPGTSGTVNFPKAFTTGVFNVFFSYSRASNITPISYWLNTSPAISLTSFTYASSTAVAPLPQALFWMAIGI